MSIKIMTKVWDYLPEDGSKLLAMLAIADWANDEGICWPSMKTIANRIRLSRSQAQRIVHALIDAGYIGVLGNHNGGAPGCSRKYRINIERLSGSANATGSVDATRADGEQDGPHEHTETGRNSAAQTVNKPSKNHQYSRSPKKNRKPSPRKTLLPENFEISPQVRAWAESNGYGNLEVHLDLFKSKCKANNYRYANHDEGFKTAIISNWLREKRSIQPENDGRCVLNDGDGGNAGQ